MIALDEIIHLVKQAIPDAQVQVDDLTGGGDHFTIVVASPIFHGKTLIGQHRLVQQSLQQALDDGRIHAIQIKTLTPQDPTSASAGTNDFKVIQ